MTRLSSWVISGAGPRPRIPENIIDVGNSGTTLYMMMGTAALVDGWTVLTADGSLSVHYEHTIAITDSEAEVLTRRVYA